MKTPRWAVKPAGAEMVAELRLNYSAALSNGAAPGPELFQQRRFVRLGGGKMRALDMAEAADFFRDRGERRPRAGDCPA